MDYASYKSGIWNTCQRQFKDGLEKGFQFAEAGKREAYHANTQREELAVNSRYLHRGVYCPSPVYHLVVTNSRHGRILLRPTKRSKITHRYFYDSQDELCIIQYFLYGLLRGNEYIEWHDNTKYGFVFDEAGVFGGFSVETYEENKLKSYMWVRFHDASLLGEGWQPDYVHYETYEYDNQGLSEVNWHFVALIQEKLNDVTEALELVYHTRYSTVYENGVLVEVVST